jgi:GTP-binding protein Era
MMKAGVVALVGRPNTGKSTFLNCVLQEQISIVTPKAQTTRDQVRGIRTEERGQIVFVDTPGIHRAKEGGINEYMIQEVRRALEAPDLVLYLLDPESKPEAESRVLEHLEGVESSLILVVNKTDLLKREPGRREWISSWMETVRTRLENTGVVFLGAVEISAIRGEGIDSLLDRIFQILPEGPPLYDDPESLTDRPLRFVVSEMIRKQLFMNLGDEIPYSCAVEIESFRESAKPVHISALIHVERESQKGMVIGAGGAKIKEIGSKARTEIEALVGEKVYLELRVKVLESWTRETRKMKDLGYALEKPGAGGRARNKKEKR